MNIIAFRKEYEEIAFTPRQLYRIWTNRVKLFVETYKSYMLDRWFKILRPEAVEDELLNLVHDEKYIEYVREMSEVGEGYLDYGDTPAYRGVYEKALLALGGTRLIVENIVSGKVKVGFNPQGGFHHAGIRRAAGFCVFNDVALAAVLLSNSGFKVAILDVDGHHGDGTQEILYERPILKVSTHMYAPGFFPGTGYVDELGSGRGYGYNVNIPLPPGVGDDTYIEVIEELIVPLLLWYKPDAVILQSGADSHLGDPLVGLALTTYSYKMLALKIASRISSVKGVVVLAGGGYAPEIAVKVWWTVLLTLVRAPDKVVEQFSTAKKPTKTPESLKKVVRDRINRLKKELVDIHGSIF